jgi:uncharacterized membrane protein
VALAGALERLDPASHTLLELSLRVQLEPADIASKLAIDKAKLSAWLDDALIHVASDAGIDFDGPSEVGTALQALPAEAWRPARRSALRDFDQKTSSETQVEPAANAVVDLGEESAPATAGQRGWWLQLGALALIAALVPARGVWAVQLILLVLLLSVPGVLVLRALRIPQACARNYPIYVVATALVVLAFSGLLVDLVGLAFGVAQPLRVVPLLVGVETVCLVLFAVGAHVPLKRRPALPAFSTRALWPLVIPVVAAAGAGRLNDGHSGAIAALALVLAICALVTYAWRADRVSRFELSVVLFGVGLAVLWSFSLRSPFVYGFDIASEYHTAAATYASGVWHASHPKDAYGATLSLTVLPSLLHALTGMSLLALFKAVYPALCALLPVAVFAVATRFLRRQYAFIAAAFIVVQTYFFQSLPALARQELALLVFVALVAAALDTGLGHRRRWGLVALLALGVVVTHYSTAYLALAMFAGAVLIQLLLSLFREVPRVTGALVAAVLALGLGAALWYGPITNSSSNVDSFSANLRAKGLDLFPTRTSGQSVLQTYISGNAPKKISARRFANTVSREFKKAHPFLRTLPRASAPRYSLADASVPMARARAPEISNGLDTGQLIVSQLANILAAIGALALVVMRRVGRIARVIGLLALATIVVLGLLRVSGTVANSYNQSRAFVQAMVVLGIAIAWVLQTTTHRIPRLARVVPVLGGLGLAALFVSMSGLGALWFGSQVQTNLANRGEDFERFYTTTPELAAATWIGSAAPPNAVMYTDRYGSLKVLAKTDRQPLTTVTPGTLNRRAWIFASRTNTVLGRARGSTNNGRYAVFRWPDHFLYDYFDTIYANGSVEVYHR